MEPGGETYEYNKPPILVLIILCITSDRCHPIVLISIRHQMGHAVQGDRGLYGLVYVYAHTQHGWLIVRTTQHKSRRFRIDLACFKKPRTEIETDH